MKWRKKAVKDFLLGKLSFARVRLVTGDFKHSVAGEKSQKVTRENDQKSHLATVYKIKTAILNSMSCWGQ